MLGNIGQQYQLRKLIIKARWMASCRYNRRYGGSKIPHLPQFGYDLKSCMLKPRFSLAGAAIPQNLHEQLEAREERIRIAFAGDDSREDDATTQKTTQNMRASVPTGSERRLDS